MSVILGTKLRSKVISYAFLRVGESFYVRQLATAIDEDAGNLSRELAKLEREGIFVSTKKANAKFYCVNEAYPLFHELKTIVSKITGEGCCRAE